MTESARKVVLGSFAALVFMGLVFLTIKANATGEPEVDSEALAKAKAAHQRGQISASAGTARARTAPSQPTRFAAPSEAPDSDSDEAPPPIPRPIQRTEAVKPVDDELEARKQQMETANKYYDRGDYEAALEQAEQVLAQEPDNVRMLRVAVSSSCIFGNADEATKYYLRLPDRDKRQMARRCARYEVTFPEP